MADEKQINSAHGAAGSAAIAENASARCATSASLPEGVVPKQAQGYVMAGLAVLILMAVMFSKNHAKPAAKDTAPAPLAVSTDMNQRKIQELEQDLSADQRQSQQQAAGAENGCAMRRRRRSRHSVRSLAPRAPAAQLPPPSQPATEPPRDPVADAEKALAFKARFASNLVSADDGASHPSAESADARGQHAGSLFELAADCSHAGSPLQLLPRPATSVRRRSTSTPRTASLMSSSRAPPSTRCW